MQRVLERLIGAGVSVEDDEDDPSSSLPQKRVSCSMSALCQWYKTVTKVRKLFKQLVSLFLEVAVSTNSNISINKAINNFAAGHIELTVFVAVSCRNRL